MSKLLVLALVVVGVLTTGCLDTDTEVNQYVYPTPGDMNGNGVPDAEEEEK